MRLRFHIVVSLVFLARVAGAQALTIHFLDVGQGDAAFIRAPSGRTVLIDAGRSPSIVAEWLRAARVGSVDLVIASHNHADHIGGIPAVLASLPVRNYMENGMASTTQIYARIVGGLEMRGIRVLEATPRRIDLGNGAELRILPSFPLARTQNDASIGVELSYGNFRALFTGDAEQRQRSFWSDSLRRIQVLKVSHHGSHNGTDRAMLEKLRPCAGIISVGARNSFGHPDPRVLWLLKNARVAAFRTDLDGQITVTADSSGRFRVSAGAARQTASFTASCEPR